VNSPQSTVHCTVSSFITDHVATFSTCRLLFAPVIILVLLMRGGMETDISHMYRTLK